LKTVGVETVYTNEEREADTTKIKRLFDMDKSAMEQLISEPNGKRFLEEFVLKPDSIHQCQRQRLLSENPNVEKVLDSIRQSTETIAEVSIPPPKPTDPVILKMLDDQVVN